MLSESDEVWPTMFRQGDMKVNIHTFVDEYEYEYNLYVYHVKNKLVGVQIGNDLSWRDGRPTDIMYAIWIPPYGEYLELVKHEIGNWYHKNTYIDDPFFFIYRSEDDNIIYYDYNGNIINHNYIFSGQSTESGYGIEEQSEIFKQEIDELRNKTSNSEIAENIWRCYDTYQTFDLISEYECTYFTMFDQGHMTTHVYEYKSIVNKVEYHYEIKMFHVRNVFAGLQIGDDISSRDGRQLDIMYSIWIYPFGEYTDIENHEIQEQYYINTEGSDPYFFVYRDENDKVIYYNYKGKVINPEEII